MLYAAKNAIPVASIAVHSASVTLVNSSKIKFGSATPTSRYCSNEGSKTQWGGENESSGHICKEVRRVQKRGSKQPMMTSARNTPRIETGKPRNTTCCRVRRFMRLLTAY